MAAGVEWIFNNGILTPASSLLANIVNKRPKITSFGNSINAQNVLGNFWALNGMVNWLHALTNAGFDRCRTIPYNWGDKFTAGSSQQGALDAWGCFGWGGAQLNEGSGVGMNSILANITDYFIDTPDVVLMANMLENDIGNMGGTAAQSVALFSAEVLKSIQIIQQKWPNALIIYSCPNPSGSYITTARQQTYTQMCAFLQSLPATYPNVLVEINTSTNLVGGTPGQPDNQYTMDGVHPNTKGALKRALAFVQQLGWLFQNALDVPVRGYASNVAVNQQLSIGVNPDFSQYTPGTVTANGVTADGTYAGAGSNGAWFYAGNNAAATVTKNNVIGGINIVASAAGTITAGLSLVSVSAGPDYTNTNAYPISKNDAYQAAVKITVNNSTNIHQFDVSFKTYNAPNGNTSNATSEIRSETQFTGAAYPDGISGMLPAGTQLTFVTPPILGGGDPGWAYPAFNFLLGGGLMTTSTLAQKPSVTLQAFNILRCDSPSTSNTLTLGSSVSPTVTAYLNNHQVTVNSTTGLAVGQFVTPSAYVAAGTYVHDISGSTVTFSLPLLGSGITGFTANNIYQNNSAGLQEIVITGTGVTFTNVYKIIGSTYVPVGTYDESATLAPATVLLGPGQMFTASWSAGTPLFAVNQLS